MKKNVLKTVLLSSVLAIASSSVSAEQIELSVTAWKGNEAEPAGLADIIKKFEAEHKDIKVDLSYIGRLDTDLVLPPRLQGNNPPDVMMVDMPLVKIWGQAGLLTDYGKDSEWYDRVTPGLKESITSDDRAFILPLEVIGMGMFSNTDLLKKAGIEKAPITLDELKSACKALDKKGINPMIFTGGYPSSLFVIETGLSQTTNKPEELGTGEKTFVEDKAFSGALDTVRELIDARCFDPKKQAGLDPWSTALNEFQGGKFAMMPQGAWNIAAFNKIEGLNYTFGPIPAANGTGIAADLFGVGWAIAAKSKKQDAARLFSEYFTKTENLQLLLDDESAYSPFTDGANGMHELAKPYDTARANGGIVNFPFALLQFPKPLEAEIWDSMTGFLLDPSKDNEDVLVRWDEAVEDTL